MERTVDQETLVLRALSNPVRQDILQLLGQAPATAAMVARSLGSNTGVTSYHLRELGKAGLIEPDEQHGRSLFWRLADADARFNDPQNSAQPGLAQAAIDLTLARFNASIRSYLTRTDLDSSWRDAALFSQSAPTMTEAELTEFTEAYLALVRRWTVPRPTPPDARSVRLAMFAYPETPPTEGPTDDNVDR